MILKNYYGYLREMSRVAMTSTTAAAGGELIDSNYMKDTGNNAMYTYRYTSSSLQGLSSARENEVYQNKSPFYNIQMVLGSDDTSVSITDYNLGNDITSSFSSISNTVVTSYIDNKGLVVTLTCSGMNATSDPITIKEIGMIKNTYFAISRNPTSSGAPQLRKILFTRDLLSEPLVVSAGGGFRIEYNVVIK